MNFKHELEDEVFFIIHPIGGGLTSKAMKKGTIKKRIYTDELDAHPEMASTISSIRYNIDSSNQKYDGVEEKDIFSTPEEAAKML